MKKFFYVFPILLFITIIAFYFVAYIALRILRALSVLFIARLDLTIPLLFGSIFNPSAALDVILLNFVMLAPFASMSDIVTLYIIGISLISLILVTFVYKSFTNKDIIKPRKAIEEEFEFSYIS